MIGLSRLPSTRRWLAECLERYGIPSRELVILWLSARQTNCSQSRPRSWARWTRNRGETRRDGWFDIEDPAIVQGAVRAIVPRNRSPWEKPFPVLPPMRCIRSSGPATLAIATIVQVRERRHLKSIEIPWRRRCPKSQFQAGSVDAACAVRPFGSPESLVLAVNHLSQYRSPPKERGAGGAVLCPNAS